MKLQHHRLATAARLAIALGTSAMLLGGCFFDDDNDEPVPNMPKASTPTSVVTETVAEPEGPVEPTLPPEAEGKGVEAAEAFLATAPLVVMLNTWFVTLVASMHQADGDELVAAVGVLPVA